MWDIETFAVPVLLLLHPSAARTLLEYRSSVIPAARTQREAQRLRRPPVPVGERPRRTARSRRPGRAARPQHEDHVSLDVAHGRSPGSRTSRVTRSSARSMRGRCSAGRRRLDREPRDPHAAGLRDPRVDGHRRDASVRPTTRRSRTWARSWSFDRPHAWGRPWGAMWTRVGRDRRCGSSSRATAERGAAQPRRASADRDEGRDAGSVGRPFRWATKSMRDRSRHHPDVPGRRERLPRQPDVIRPLRRLVGVVGDRERSLQLFEQGSGGSRPPLPPDPRIRPGGLP